MILDDITIVEAIGFVGLFVSFWAGAAIVRYYDSEKERRQKLKDSK